MMQSAANEIREGRFCKRCGEKLEYGFYHYSQLGDYHCPKCGFARPELNFDAEDVKVGDQLSFRVEDKHIVANYKGFYNVYNILAAYAGLPQYVQQDLREIISRICFRNLILKTAEWSNSESWEPELP